MFATALTVSPFTRKRGSSRRAMRSLLTTNSESPSPTDVSAVRDHTWTFQVVRLSGAGTSMVVWPFSSSFTSPAKYAASRKLERTKEPPSSPPPPKPPPMPPPISISTASSAIAMSALAAFIIMRWGDAEGAASMTASSSMATPALNEFMAAPPPKPPMPPPRDMAPFRLTAPPSMMPPPS